MPENAVAQLNHSYGLIANDRTIDAFSVLSNIDESTLIGDDQNRYHLAWMVIHFRDNRLKESWNAAQKVLPEELLPEFRTHFRTMHESLQLEDPAQFQPNLSLIE